jgi:PAS domain S-box-containing protein
MELTVILILLLITALAGVTIRYYWRARQLARLLAERDAVSHGLEQLLEDESGVWACSPDGILICDEDGQILWVNYKLHEMFGHSPSALLGNKLAYLFPENRHIELKDLCFESKRARQLIMGLDGIGDGLKARRKDGSLFSAEIALARSKQNYYVVSIRDISERAGVALQIMASTPNAIFAYDRHSMDIIFANQSAAKLLGYSREELLAMNALDLLELESQSVFRDHFQRMDSGDRQIRARTYLYRTKSAANITADVSIHFVDHDENSYLISIGRDVSERIEAMNAIEYKSIELQELNEQLSRERENLEQQVLERTRQLDEERKNAEQANLAKSSFLAAMSHEIRTPMNGVVSMIELLQESELDEDQRAKTDTIQDSAQSLLTIIDEILDFSKVEAGRIELACEDVNLAEFANSVYNSLQALAARRNVTLGFYFDPSLSKVIRADSTRLRQILNNLVGNAIKFSSEAEAGGKVMLRLEALARDSMQIVVEDNGIGISEERLESIFEPFEQEDQHTTARFGGTGLGLPITRALVDKMQGSIRVSSQQNVLTSFTVSLPVLVAEQQPEQDDFPAGTRLQGKYCVLLASDERRSRNWRDWLKLEGAEVVCVSDQENLLTSLRLRADGEYTLAGIVLGEEFDQETARQIDLQLSKRNLDKFILLHLPDDSLKEKYGNWQLLVDQANENQNFDNVLRLLNEGSEEYRKDEESSPETEQGATAVDMPTDGPQADRLKADGPINVLVAEDNPINQSVISSQLEALGFCSTLVSDGQQALEAWARKEHSLLLTDLHMPNMDGYTLAREIRRREVDNEYTPIIAYTANAVKGERDRCLDCGMDDYLTKPIALKDLEEKISNWSREARLMEAVGDGYGPAEPESGPESSDNSPDPNCLDVEVLKGLVGDKPELIQRLLLTYQDSLQSSSSKIHNAYEANNWEDLEAVAHTLKSSSRSVGALPLGELCETLEEAGRSKNITAAAAAMVPFHEAVESVQAQLLSHLAVSQNEAHSARSGEAPRGHRIN